MGSWQELGSHVDTTQNLAHEPTALSQLAALRATLERRCTDQKSSLAGPHPIFSKV